MFFWRIPFSTSIESFFGLSFSDGHVTREVEIASCKSFIMPVIFLSPVMGRAQITVQKLQVTWKIKVVVKIQRRLMKTS